MVTSDEIASCNRQLEPSSLKDDCIRVERLSYVSTTLVAIDILCRCDGLACCHFYGPRFDVLFVLNLCMEIHQLTNGLMSNCVTEIFM